MAQIGVTVELTLEKAGFYPRGGGQILANIEPVAGSLQPLQRGHRPTVQRLQVYSLQTSDLASGKDRRQTEGFVARLKRHRRLIGVLTELERREGRFEFAGSTGTAFLAVAETDLGNAGFQQLGERNRRAESVGEAAADELIAYLESGAAVDRYTADQILVTLALAEGPSVITTSELTGHLRTLMNVTRQFIDVAVEVDEALPVRIAVKPLRGWQPQ
jgi:RNA 3'-terminal phosphate cyclase (ATP)